MGTFDDTVVAFGVAFICMVAGVAFISNAEHGVIYMVIGLAFFGGAAIAASMIAKSAS